MASMTTEAAKSAPGSEATTSEPLAANLGWLLGQASHTLATEQTAALERLGISPRSYCLLTTAMGGEHTQSELAQKVGLDKTTMVVTLDELEATGLAERRPSPDDRRARVVVVTDAGRRKVAEGREIVEGIQADVLAALPARERKVLVDALSRLVGDRLAHPTPCSQPVRRRAPR
jgi:MarR family transcriptional regulator, transcriptional regulator for hemolysin